MALATLYSKARLTNYNLPQIHGIIIDHKARPESTEEAEWVAEQLRLKLDIDSTIIPLKWPDGYDVLGAATAGNKSGKESSFESKAREFRYQALGRLCRDKNIYALLVAHHADDQAETVFMRLMSKRWRWGLQGMQPVEWIPECYGIHGVHQSGSIRRLVTGLPMQIEKGGIQVLRPLLGFEKSRLITTCQENGIVWAEDKTNQIPSLTARNSVRHVMQYHTLPPAISSKSLVSVAVRMQKRIKSHQEAAENLFNECPIQLDLQTGSLIVRFPPASSLLDRPIVTDSDKHSAKNTAMLLVDRIAELVSPRNRNKSIGRASIGVETIYPIFRTELVLSKDEQNFCVWGLWFRRWDKPTPFASPELPAEPHKMEWLLCRQPFQKSGKEQATTRITIQPLHVDCTAGNEWHLFDGRYWIRVKNHGDRPVTIRPFEREDVLEFMQDNRSATETEHSRVPPDCLINAALNLIKTKDLRRHFPGIYRTNKDGREILIALPTFLVTVEDPKHDKVRYDIRYKKIDLGLRSPKDIITKGITKTDISEQVRRLRNKNRVLAKRFDLSGETGLKDAQQISEKAPHQQASGGKKADTTFHNSKAPAAPSPQAQQRPETHNMDQNDLEGLDWLTENEVAPRATTDETTNTPK
ncbi:hypothetical protein K505DRAFT_238222 [Melanomma pulvis-pyrius CBS 109.77]|uniref:tRNA(Ile)-lysidine synthetase n=1 Tax=Melanomma pulvis-pyrius CBS 109.77 TaxID=1314802 RepID=A0A6A6XL06_9PLEO|nr:hypothetical protein K505DRAFT_238222 [Melanomma pulvis-pyrius CBS 109.77]